LLFHSSGIAYAAHLSGNLVGFLVGLLLLMTRLVQRDHYDLLAVLDRYRRRKVYESVVASGYDPFGRSPSGSIARGKDSAPAVDPAVEKLRFDIGNLIHAHRLPAAVEKYLDLKRMVPAESPWGILGADDQLDISNQLMADGKHAEAARAYEDYLKAYPGGTQSEQATLVLALIYSQYLPNVPRAIELLQNVIPRLHDAQQRRFAEEELARLKTAGG
jgi:hypothetical protein